MQRITTLSITLLLALCCLDAPAEDAKPEERLTVVRTKDMTVTGKYLIWPVDKSNHKKEFSTLILSENGKEINRRTE